MSKWICHIYETLNHDKDIGNNGNFALTSSKNDIFKEWFIFMAGVHVHDSVSSISVKAVCVCPKLQGSGLLLPHSREEKKKKNKAQNKQDKIRS